MGLTYTHLLDLQSYQLQYALRLKIFASLIGAICFAVLMFQLLPNVFGYQFPCYFQKKVSRLNFYTPFKHG